MKTGTPTISVRGNPRVTGQPCGSFRLAGATASVAHSSRRVESLVAGRRRGTHNPIIQKSAYPVSRSHPVPRKITGSLQFQGPPQASYFIENMGITR